MQVISNIALISINETLFVQLISFLIFLFIIQRIMFRPLKEVISERENYIGSVKQGVVNAKDSLEELISELKDREFAASIEADELKTELENIGRREASEIFESVGKEIDEIKEAAAKNVNHQILEAKKHIKKESEILAISIAEKILDRRLIP